MRVQDLDIIRAKAVISRSASGKKKLPREGTDRLLAKSAPYVPNKPKGLSFRLNAVWKSSNRAPDVEDTDEDADEETVDQNDDNMLHLLQRAHVVAEDDKLVPESRSPRSGGRAGSGPRGGPDEAGGRAAPRPSGASHLTSPSQESLLPTLTPSKHEASMGAMGGSVGSRFTAILYGNRVASNAVVRAAIRGVMIRVGVRFLTLRVPLMFGTCLLYVVATKWLAPKD